MAQLQGHSITYRIAVGPPQGRKVFTLQTLPPDDDSLGGTPPCGSDRVAKEAGYSFGASLHLTLRAAELCKSAFLRICRCTPVYRPRHTSATNSTGRAALRFAATLRGRRCQRSVWQSPPTEISAISLGGPAKTPYRDGTTHVIFERGGLPSLDFIAKLVALAWPAAYEAAHKSDSLCSYHP